MPGKNSFFSKVNQTKVAVSLSAQRRAGLGPVSTKLDTNFLTIFV
jgi:hypothetical protein